MSRLIQTNRQDGQTHSNQQTANAKITAVYNAGLWKGILKCTMHHALKWMDYSSGRPCRVPLLFHKHGRDVSLLNVNAWLNNLHQNLLGRFPVPY